MTHLLIRFYLSCLVLSCFVSPLLLLLLASPAVTAGLDCMVFVTDFFSGQVLKRIDTDNSFVFSLDIAADNSVFATAAQDGCVRIYSRAHRWECVR